MTQRDVTVAILTHARTALLSEALYSAAHLDSDRVREIVVLNDCPEQTLICKHPLVTIINVPRQFSSVGAKRLALAGLCQTTWIAWLDDDDVLLPHHLAKLAQLDGTSINVLGSEQTYWFCGDKGEIKSGACADTIMRRAAFINQGCPDLSVGEDWPAVERLTVSGGRHYDTSKHPSYIERWCNGAHHVSGRGNTPDAGESFRNHALSILRDGLEPSGTLEITTRAPALDYAALCGPILETWWQRVGRP